jgi:tight adherence protein C
MQQAAGSASSLWSPLTFALLLGIATWLVWQAIAPARRRPLDTRLQDYVEGDLAQATELDRPFAQRVLAPGLHGVLRTLGGLMPKRNLEKLRTLLIYAGEPGGFTVLDFTGLRLLSAVAFGAGIYWSYARHQPMATLLLATLGAVFLGYMLPWLWLRGKARRRQKEIQRALPDALDMLTIAVEAGLAFESGLLRVGEQWRNALSEEFRRVVGEMRMGVTRSASLERLVARTDVQELATFVAVLVQSTNLGVSIAQVLQTQAAQMRERRRQRAEELARQASVKIVLVLVVCFFPVLFIVVLGPMIPQLMVVLNSMQR